MGRGRGDAEIAQVDLTTQHTGLYGRTDRDNFVRIDTLMGLFAEELADELLAFRSRLVLVSRLAGIASPIDGPCTSWEDTDLLRAGCQRARRLGFGGKLCIHPRQVATVNAAFAPSETEIAWPQKTRELHNHHFNSTVWNDFRFRDGDEVTKMPQFHASEHTFKLCSGKKHGLSQQASACGSVSHDENTKSKRTRARRTRLARHVSHLQLRGLLRPAVDGFPQLARHQRRSCDAATGRDARDVAAIPHGSDGSQWVP